MPRNEAALRYSPLIAAALAVGRTARAATRKSEVVRAKRRANTPTATVATSMASRPKTAAGEVIQAPPPLRGRWVGHDPEGGRIDVYRYSPLVCPSDPPSGPW